MCGSIKPHPRPNPQPGKYSSGIFLAFTPAPLTHHHEQHCDCSGVIQIPGHHHLSGPEVGQSHCVHGEKDPGEAVLGSSVLGTEEVQPGTGAAEKVLLCHH